jgi:hypothetical protein
MESRFGGSRLDSAEVSVQTPMRGSGAPPWGHAGGTANSPSVSANNSKVRIDPPSPAAQSLADRLGVSSAAVPSSCPAGVLAHRYEGWTFLRPARARLSRPALATTSRIRPSYANHYPGFSIYLCDSCASVYSRKYSVTVFLL